LGDFESDICALKGHLNSAYHSEIGGYPSTAGACPLPTIITVIPVLQLVLPVTSVYNHTYERPN
jgi:hypothetical protein